MIVLNICDMGMHASCILMNTIQYDEKLQILGGGHLGFEPEFSHYAASYVFYQLNNSSNGFLMSTNIPKDSPCMTFCQLLTKM